MFERFTEHARQVVVLAQEEARGLKHGYIGTEHILLGLLREQNGAAAHVLERFDVTPDRARALVVRHVEPGEHTAEGPFPFTPRAKKVLELALREALALGHNYIGTEHILLGIGNENGGVGAQILAECGADPEKIRNEVIRTLSGQVGHPDYPGAAPPSSSGFDEWIRVGPGVGVRRLLMVAAARALDDGRSQISSRDVLLALTRDATIGPALADLGIDEAAVIRALERRQPPEEPPQASAG